MNTKCVLLIVALAGLLVAGCAEPAAKVTPSLWLLSGANVQDAESENDIEDSLEYVAMFMLQIDKTALGIVSDYWMGSDPRQSYGVRAIQFLPMDPNSILGQPYLGAQATLDVEEDSGGMYGFVAGTILPIGGLNVVTEIQARQYSEDLANRFSGNDEVKAFVGLQFEF